jgi:hypothetical protein
MYTTGTVVLTALALAGTNTVWKKILNVAPASLYFAYQADVMSDGTYPWAQLATIADDTTATLAAAYTGASATGAYIISSDNSYSAEFDPYMIYSATILECSRNREMNQLAQMMTSERDQQLAGLKQNQMSLPDFTDGVQDFAREPVLLGDDYAKFPFIQGNP